MTFKANFIGVADTVPQSAATSVILVPSFRASLAVSSLEVEVNTVLSSSKAGSVTKSLPFRTASERVDELQTLSFNHSVILILATGAVSCQLVVLLAKGRNFFAEHAVLGRELSFLTLNLSAGPVVGVVSPLAALTLKGSAVELNALFLNVLALSVLFVLLVGASDHSGDALPCELAVRILLEFVA